MCFDYIHPTPLLNSPQIHPLPLPNFLSSFIKSPLIPVWAAKVLMSMRTSVGVCCLPGATSLRKSDPKTLQLVVGAHELPLPPHETPTSVPNPQNKGRVAKSHAGNHSCSEFMRAVSLPCPEDTISMRSIPTSVLTVFPVPHSWALRRDCDNDISSMTELSTDILPLSFGRLWVSVLTIHYVKRLLWWGLKLHGSMGRELWISKVAWYCIHLAK